VLWLAQLVMPFAVRHVARELTAKHPGLGPQEIAAKMRAKLGRAPNPVLEPAARAAADYGLWLPLAVLVASHLFSFAWNYLYRGELRRAQLSSLMAKPYGRVVVLHIAIILGGIGAMALGSPVWALLVLLAMKIGLDWKAHVKEHSKA